ncbi:putative defense protein Hdd11-like [Dreissena polymorpha]|uniref:putative defense protein Hdd11-like n=1 Tax=Dreissena polymorpha TaxID=45954 RepID=UPI002264C265|nr:putative defense protein Hdd11-like [Dreissena polymorpha]
MSSIKKVLIFAAVVGLIHGYPSGAPNDMCGRYVPGHPNLGTPVSQGPRTGPYSITVTPSAGGNGLYDVRLQATSNTPFRGFLIQAMPSWKQLPEGPSDIVGTFQRGFNSQLRDCRGMTGSSALTHESRQPKMNIQAVWQAPMNTPDPNIKFVATVVQDNNNFYVVHSDPINVQGQGQGQ